MQPIVHQLNTIRGYMEGDVAYVLQKLIFNKGLTAIYIVFDWIQSLYELLFYNQLVVINLVVIIWIYYLFRKFRKIDILLFIGLLFISLPPVFKVVPSVLLLVVGIAILLRSLSLLEKKYRYLLIVLLLIELLINL